MGDSYDLKHIFAVTSSLPSLAQHSQASFRMTFKLVYVEIIFLSNI